ncbi:unnamed protein product [Pleuronectes platessa]|uniref:Uncharacterized protein n=1 Tax=Pleuronectes platessa TaxID=8262 RepID=A0A9N7YQM3_PLEPL|nr:unnamed protein product [Pleuronectes platessa]
MNSSRQAGRQTDRTRNEPGQEIRFLGGFAMGTGLQSTAARGRGRSRGGCSGGEGVGSDGVIKPVQGLGWTNGPSGNPTSATTLPPSVTQWRWIVSRHVSLQSE